MNTITVYERKDNLSKQNLGLRLRQRGLGTFINQLTLKGSVPSSQSTPTNLQAYADAYGEQVTADAAADLDKYFGRVAPSGYTVGGLPTQPLPLSGLPGNVRPSNTSISVLGEGIAGWYLQTQGWVSLSRPIGEPVDLICRDQNLGQVALVQKKATQEPTILSQLRAAAPPLLQFAANVALENPRSLYVCYIVGVIIKLGRDFDVHSLRITIV